MNAKLKWSKFRTGDTGIVVRYEVLPSKKIIAFGISGTDLTVLQFGNDIDFDSESDVLIEKHKDSQDNLAFEYIPNIGFDGVDTAIQKFFKF